MFSNHTVQKDKHYSKDQYETKHKQQKIRKNEVQIQKFNRCNIAFLEWAESIFYISLKAQFIAKYYYKHAKPPISTAVPVIQNTKVYIFNNFSNPKILCHSISFIYSPKNNNLKNEGENCDKKKEEI